MIQPTYMPPWIGEYDAPGNTMYFCLLMILIKEIRFGLVILLDQG